MHRRRQLDDDHRNRAGAVGMRRVFLSLCLALALVGVSHALSIQQPGTLRYVTEVENATSGASSRVLYLLDETSGTAAADHFGGTDGTHNGTVTVGQPGLLVGDEGKTALYDGSTGYTTMPAGAVVDATADFWVAAVVRPESLTAEHVYFSLGNSGTNTPFFRLYRISDGRGSMQIVDDAGTSVASNAGGTWATGAVQHVLVGRRGDDLELWVNGDLVVTNDISGLGAITFDRATIGVLRRVGNASFGHATISRVLVAQSTPPDAATARRLANSALRRFTVMNLGGGQSMQRQPMGM